MRTVLALPIALGALVMACSGSGNTPGGAGASGGLGGATGGNAGTGGSSGAGGTGLVPALIASEIAWVVSIGSDSADISKGVGACPDGTSFFVGDPQGAASLTTFAKGEANETTTSTSWYVASYAADGTFRWVLPIKGKYGNSKISVQLQVVEKDCSLVLTGSFGSSGVDDELFIGDTPTATLSGNGVNHFIAQVDNTGQSVNATLAASVVGTTLYRDGQLTVVQDDRLSRVDLSGNLLWEKPISVQADTFSILAADLAEDGSIVVGGRWQGGNNIVFDPGGPNESTLEVQFGSNDEAFVAAYDPTGLFLWANIHTSQGSDRVNSVTALPKGALGAVGNFGIGKHIDIGRYSKGGHRKGRTIGSGDHTDDGRAIASVGEHLFIGGVLGDGAAAAEDFKPHQIALPAQRLGILASYDADNMLRWVLPLPDVTTRYLATDSAGALYAVGQYSAAVSFETAPTPTSLVAAGSSDIFLAKIVEKK